MENQERSPHRKTLGRNPLLDEEEIKSNENGLSKTGVKVQRQDFFCKKRFSGLL